jgi:hypothetical protein
MGRLYSDNDVYRLVDVSGHFLAGMVINYSALAGSAPFVSVVITGSTSGATATVTAKDGTALTVGVVTGEFIDGEVITYTGGSATITSIVSPYIRLYDEPEGFDKANIILERQPKHGVDSEFFDEESQLIFDDIRYKGDEGGAAETYSGHEVLEGLYAVDGSDAKAQLKYFRTDALDLIYTSDIVFSERFEEDHATQVRCERLDYDVDIKNRQDTLFDLNRTTNLNGGAYTAPTFNDVALFPQLTIKGAKLKKVDDSEVITSTTYNKLLINFGQATENNFPVSPVTYNLQDIGTSIVGDTFDIQKAHTLEITEFGLYRIADVLVDLSVEISSSSLVSLKYVVYDQRELVVHDGTIKSYLISGGDIGVLTNVNFDSTATTTSWFWCNKGMKIVIYVDCDAGDIFDTVSQSSASCTLQAETRSGYLVTKYVEIKAAYNKLIEGLSGVSNAVSSTFLDSQDAGLLTGELVRGFPSTRPFKVSHLEFVKSFEAIFGLGYSITNESGLTVNVEQHDFFYQNKEIASFSDLTDDYKSFVKGVAKDLIHNKIEVGYENYDKGNKATFITAGKGDFLTRQEILTPIRRDESKATLISPFIASGHLIEEGKQLNYATYPNENWDHDESKFIIALNDTDTLYQEFAAVYGGCPQSASTYNLVIQNYCPQIDAATEFTFNWNGFEETVTIDDIYYDQDSNLTFVGFNTLPTSWSGTTLVWSTDVEAYAYDIVFDVTWKTAESSQPFSVFSIENGLGLSNDKHYQYNARYNPKYMLYANSLILNSGLAYKADTEKYKVLSYIGDNSFNIKFDTGEDYSTLDPDRNQVDPSADIEIGDVNQGIRLMKPDIIEVELPVPYATIIYIKEAYENVNGDDVNYGYVTFTYEGTDYKAFIKRMDYNVVTEMVKFTGYVKA